MHAQYRDLDSRYRRVLNDLQIAKKKEKVNNDKVSKMIDEVTKLKTDSAQNES
jgi:transcriptional regulator NrdR family protein